MILEEAGETAVLHALLHAREYALQESLPYTFLMEQPIDEAQARAAIQWLREPDTL
ncbi:MAG: hypothetical protein NZM10_03855 [Fimbriimonadales bacterium]|nr:hypothetical protein [Fimbriimonadales bacterium]MCS7191337.1 hypothetical protein [Fimbriimonadales bacterium]